MTSAFYYIAALLIAYAGATLPVRAWHHSKGKMPTWGAVLTCLLAPLSGYALAAACTFGVIFVAAFLDMDARPWLMTMLGGSATGTLVGGVTAAYRAFTHPATQAPVEQANPSPSSDTDLFNDA